MSDLNVILPQFMLLLLLGLMFRMFRNGYNTYINYYEKNYITHIFCEGNTCDDKFTNL